MVARDYIKTLFVDSEIKRIKTRISDYEKIYNVDDVRDLLLRRLILVKREELKILEEILQAKNGYNHTEQ